MPDHDGRQRFALVMAYQNDLTAADIFMPHQPRELALIHPVRFAEQLARAKTAANARKGHPEACPARVEVYRGLPGQEIHPHQHRRNLAQRERWLKDAKNHDVDLDVHCRALKYRHRWVNGRREIDPAQPAQEKGVDALCALAMVRLAQAGMYDAVILASRDTDLVPSLVEANGSETHVGTVKWFEPDVPECRGSLRPDTFRLRTTSLDERAFHLSPDGYAYN